jgi:hypothetical protein
MVLTSTAVPSYLMGKLHTVHRIVQSVAPVSAFSSMCLKAIMPGQSATPPLAEGVDRAEAEFEDEVRRLMIKRAYEEDMTGLGQEALFLMRRGGKWGDWGDYDRLVEMLAAQEEVASVKVRVRVYFAESDMMIGKDKGPAWFDKCWTTGMGAGQIDYRSSRVPDADHDSILDIRFGVDEKIFKEIALLAEEVES